MKITSLEEFEKHTGINYCDCIEKINTPQENNSSLARREARMAMLEEPQTEKAENNQP